MLLAKQMLPLFFTPGGKAISIAICMNFHVRTVPSTKRVVFHSLANISVIH